MTRRLPILVLTALLVTPLSFAIRADEPQDKTSPATPADGQKKDSATDKNDVKSQSPTSPPPAPRIDPAAELLGRLKPDKLKSLSEMIEQDWKDRPEWAEMALAIMRGQGMEGTGGWWRATDKKYGWTWLKRKYDKNSDNVVKRDEFEDSSPRMDLFFNRLDRDLDGKVSPSDFDVSVFQGMTPAAMKARMIGMLVSRLDSDTNGQVTMEEISRFFERADREKTSFLNAEDILEALKDEEPQGEPQEDPTASQLLNMFFSGQLGCFEEGPKLGNQAPNFTLEKHDRSGTITLSDFKEKKPIVLIFGSFT